MREPSPRHEKHEFHHSGAQMGSVMRGVIKMTAAGWLIERLELKDQLHKTLAFAAVGVGVGYVESIMRQRKEADWRWNERDR